MNCRPACAACCIAPSISTPIPRPNGQPAQPKPANVACWQLDEQLRCRLFGHTSRPAVCSSLRPAPDLCGSSTGEAMTILHRLESLTAPDQAGPATTAT